MNKHNFGILFYKNSINLGDEIQSIAALRLIKKFYKDEFNIYYINRDNGDIYDKGYIRLTNFDEFTHNKINCIYNGWFDGDYHTLPNKDTIKYLNILFISYHINEQEKNKNYDILENSKINFNSLYHQSLKPFYDTYSPIYCRDLSTLNKLSSIGVNSLFSGCLTMTLARTRKIEDIKKNCIYIVDVNKKSYDEIPRDIIEQAIHITHITDTKDNNTKFLEAEKLINIYSNAKLVITSRLHVILPCLAFKTPCIMMFDEIDKDCRFDGLEKYMTIFDKDTIDWYNHMNKNNEEFDSLVDNIENILKNWIFTL